MNRQFLITVSLAALSANPATVLPVLAADAFPDVIPVLDGSPHEGFTIGRGKTAYSGSPDGSIYKFDLRSGEGEVIVAREPDFDIENECFKLGMRVDRRTNNLFVAGCLGGNAYVFNGETGEELMNYQLAPQFSTVINDLVIVQNKVYFTDFTQPYLYVLQLGPGGSLPSDPDAATPLELTGPFVDDDPTCCAGNGIEATPNGKSIIVANSNNSKIYRVDPETGETEQIVVEPPIDDTRFIDAIILRNRTLYVLTPDFPEDPAERADRVQVVALDNDLRAGTLIGIITDPNLDGVASGALLGNSLYVNNARYFDFPAPETEYWITRLNIFGWCPAQQDDS